MEKSAYYNDMVEIFRLFYPEKTEDEIHKMIDRSYEKFKDVIRDM